MRKELITMSMKEERAVSAEIKDVEIGYGLFGRVSDLIREYVIPYQWEILNDRVADAKTDHSIENFSVAINEGKKEYPSHCIANFRIAAGEESGDFYGMVFQDSDLAKWIEAVAYSLMTHPDKELEKTIDQTIALIGRAQQTDGYLNTYFTIREPGKRFTNLCECHELYCAGHMMEAAVAYFQATGKRELLDVMTRMAQCIDNALGPRDEEKLPGYPGHEEIELALVKMYRITGNQNLLRLATFFINERGNKPLYFDEEFEKRGHDSHFSYLYPPYGMYSLGQKYEQYHMPLREQKEFVGHAVRCMYMACGMVDVAVETDDQTLLDTCKTLFANMAARRLYITGGIGSTPSGEMFTCDYDLPNDMVYGETCASVGLIFFMQRMLLIEQDRKYSDVMERALFNTCLSGMSLDGKKFFYVNPLEVNPAISKNNPDKKHVLAERPAWFGCACCPPNLARLITSLGEYIYSVKGRNIYMHLYMSNYVSLEVQNHPVVLDVQTEYPYDGRIAIKVSEGDYVLCLRIPEWSKSFSIKVNGEEASYTTAHGYAQLERKWHDNEKVELTLEMTPRRIHANPKVADDIGKVAIQRGPIVYCMEEVDNGPGLQQIYLPNDAELQVVKCPDRLNGIDEIRAKGKRVKETAEDVLYTYDESLKYEDINLTFIPYYTWANRGENEMTVWTHEL
jgi:DUF1680 family protein